MSKKNLKPIMLVISATLLWSIGAPIGKFVQSPALTLIFFRCLSGLTVLIAAMAIRKSGKLFNLNLFSILGGVFYALTTLCFYSSLW